MTRPIYEPSLPRADAELGYGRDQLFRRPAPTISGMTSAALMHEIDFENAGDENVAAATWELITDGSGARFFTEGWRLSDEWNLDFDGDESFTNSTFSLYESWVSVELGNAVDGDTIGVAVQYAVSSSFFYPNLIVVAGGIDRVDTMAARWGTLAYGPRFWVYASSVRAITRCEVFCRRFELSADGELIAFP